MTLLALAGACLAACAAALSSSGVAATTALCPREVLPLGRNPIAPASEAAVARVPASDEPQVTSAVLTHLDQVRGLQARRECGRAVWERTIVVYVLARAALPAQSASQRVFFVARFRGGYRVWQSSTKQERPDRDQDE
jgi:hypothetical protein